MKGKAIKVLVVVADGSDEIGTTVTADVLRRADIQVTVSKVSIESSSLEWKSAQGLTFVADARFEDIQDKPWDAIVVPGGKTGNEILLNSKSFVDRIVRQKADNKYLAGIGEAPTLVLLKSGLLENEKATTLLQVPEQNWEKEPVVISGKIVTGKSQGSAFMFALALGELLVGKKKIEEVKRGLLYF